MPRSSSAGGMDQPATGEPQSGCGTRRTRTTSPLLAGGRADLQPVVEMESGAAMIVYGDVAVQVGDRPSADGFEALESYTDEAGRERVRLVWSE